MDLPSSIILVLREHERSERWRVQEDTANLRQTIIVGVGFQTSTASIVSANYALKKRIN